MHTPVTTEESESILSNMAGNFIDGFSQTIEDQRISMICKFFHNIGKLLICNFK